MKNAPLLSANRQGQTKKRDYGTVSRATLSLVRARLLQMHFEAGVGHIGGNLSCVDAVTQLHLEVMSKEDVFVLSKGHAAGALYAALWARGSISDADLKTYHQDNTLLSAHPAAGWNADIPFATGSLGHGLGLACGVALAKNLRREAGDIYCLLGDGECQEGSVWEGLTFAQHHNLSNLVVLIDQNKLQGFCRTDGVSSVPLTQKLRGFGLKVEAVDGHDPKALNDALGQRGDGPLVIVLNTIKGRGVSFMEDRLEWHYLPLSESQFRQALRELGPL